MLTRHDPRYVPSDDPRAVLRAWSGPDGTIDMGGWTEPDEATFRAALQNASRQSPREVLSKIIIERMD